MKLLFLDLETGGVDPHVNGILQLSGEIWINGVKAKAFNRFVKPMGGDMVTDEALEVTGMTREEIDSDKHIDPRVTYKGFIKMMSSYVNRYKNTDKFHMVGYNANFDSGMLREFFQKNGDVYYGSWFFYPHIDVMHLWAGLLITERVGMPNFQLKTVAKHVFGDDYVDESRLHDAEYDIELTKELYFEYMKRVGVEGY